jgi:hypothetical protein
MLIDISTFQRHSIVVVVVVVVMIVNWSINGRKVKRKDQYIEVGSKSAIDMATVN